MTEAQERRAEDAVLSGADELRAMITRKTIERRQLLTRVATLDGEIKGMTMAADLISGAKLAAETFSAMYGVDDDIER